jgi:predicted nucleotide-binding protein
VQLEVKFPETRFPVSAVRKFYDGWLEMAGSTAPNSLSLSVSRGEESWRLDNLEEFYSEYDNDFEAAGLFASNYGYQEGTKQSTITFEQTPFAAKATVETMDRTDIMKVMNILRESRNLYKIQVEIPVPEKPRVFIGHGRGTAWEKLYRHLKDQHHLDVFSFETEERAGQTIQGFLTEAMHIANFALMVMTADDMMRDGEVRARQNVVHETGLFQGCLGWTRVILIAESGTERYSNLAGTQEIRFDQGNIEATTGRILAVLKRSFPSEH